MNTAFSPDGGATWQLTTGSIVPLGAQSYGSDASATTLPNGTTLQAWAGTLGTWVHAGLDPATPNTDYQAPSGCCGYYPGLATDASGVHYDGLVLERDRAHRRCSRSRSTRPAPPPGRR